jgi:hypothetical protein
MYLRLLKHPHSVNAKKTAVKRTDISYYLPNISCYGILNRLSSFDIFFVVDEDFIKIFQKIKHSLLPKIVEELFICNNLLRQS